MVGNASMSEECASPHLLVLSILAHYITFSVFTDCDTREKKGRGAEDHRVVRLLALLSASHSFAASHSWLAVSLTVSLRLSGEQCAGLSRP